MPKRPVLPKNKDRISPWILAGVGIGAVLLAAAAVIFDANVSREDIGAWADVLLYVLGIVGAGGGALAAAQRAKQGVTPIGPDDTPQDAKGRRLVPVVHDEEAGYPRSAEEQAEQLQRYPRVDKRGVDREPPPGF